MFISHDCGKDLEEESSQIPAKQLSIVNNEGSQLCCSSVRKKKKERQSQDIRQGGPVLEKHSEGDFTQDQSEDYFGMFATGVSKFESLSWHAAG